ncbi:hypothetical protein N865_15560 [Intrasporangium oryzae NRRL B-24470]|uniref:Uncharacterized protein n=1 Tax=Intrasporangium oryzae NRRL B-24470 TaxID=1386089 RepID=W9G593_9MICO|nr:hypothetical protein [Intrasporangium oryzae]EWT00477.1 hypothetical protein N865_15560 [Intrasporangium oryzae NRRL B-24470]
MKYRQEALSHAPARIDARRGLRWTRLWPGVVVLAVTVWITVMAGVPAAAVGVYLLAFVWSVMVPGMLVHRALRGRPSSLVADLALGGATGLVLQLIAWATFTAFHVAAWLVLWPLAVVIPFVALPGLRHHWRLTTYPSTVPPVAAWLGVLAYLLPLSGIAGEIFATEALPQGASTWYPDDLWHLALSAELMRSVPPDIPQIAGRTFFYHWFSNAHIAAMTWTTGLDLPMVLARLWMPAIVALSVGMMFAIGEQLTRRAWPGAVAALLMAGSAAVLPSWFGLYGFSAFGFHSPSQVFSIPIIGLALHVLIQSLRDQRFGRGAWAVLALALVGSSGAKSSVLPVLVCGIVLTLAVAVLVQRRMVRRLVGILALSMTVLVSTSILTAAAGAGVTLQLFSTVRASRPWALMMDTTSPFSKAPVLPGLDRAGAVVLLALILISWAVGYAWVLPGLRALGRRDLSGWLLLGVGLGGWAAMMVLSQDGLSQVYFMSGAVVALYALAGWGLALAWDRARARAGSRPALLAAAIGAGLAVPLVLLARRLSGPVPAPAGLNSSLARALLVPAVVVVIAVAAALLGRRRRYAAAAALVFLAVSTGVITASLLPRAVPGSGERLPAGSSAFLIGAGLLVVLCAVVVAVRPRLARGVSRRVLSVGASLVLGLTSLALVLDTSSNLDARLAAVPAVTSATVSAEEASAARWLEGNSEPDDVVATNVHCRQKKTVPLCDSRAYWVTAFTQRRALVESWAYTAAAHEAHGVGGRPYSRQPFDDPRLFALNEAAFSEPSAATLAALRDRGVRWLFADTAAGPVSPRLDSLADLVHESGTVRIFRLR